MTEAVGERRFSSLYLSKETFYQGSPSVDFDTVPHACATEGPFEISGVVDEEDRVSNIVFLEKLGKEILSDRDRIRWEQLDMEELVGLRTDRGVSPVLFVIDANHGLVQRNVIRRQP